MPAAGDNDESFFKNLDDYEDIKNYIDWDMLNEPIDESNFPEFVPDFSTSIVVDNLPQVPQEKIEKLASVLLSKIYSQVETLSRDALFMPFDDAAGTTYGFAFIKFSKKENAEKAVKLTQDFAMDKRHTFKVNLYSDLDKYGNVPDEFTPPPPPPFNPRPDPTSWLSDSQCRDQLVLRHGPETGVYWCNSTGEQPALVYGGDREKQGGKVWCESYVTWSPQGTYLATFHPPGIKLWGSDEFVSQGKFMHPKVEELSFSPCEKYMVTYRYSFQQNVDPAESIIVWDVRSQSKLRAFDLKNPLDVKFQVTATVEQKVGSKTVERQARGRVKAYDGDSSGGLFTIEEGNTVHKDVPSDRVHPMQEPNRLKWSPDGNYLARLGPDIISVYELPSMQLLERKSIAAKDVLEFSWSPRSNLISYWAPAIGNLPAMINIIQVPSRENICSRKIFDVTDGRMVWQNEGEYLCVHMTKIAGKKKSYVLMFFRVKSPGVPVEQLELTEPIINVSWEPSGDRLVIMHGEARSPTISFYSMAGAGSSGGAMSSVVVGADRSAASSKAQVKNELTLLFTKTGSQCNEVLWSPAGGVVAMAYFAPDSCIFELHDVENNVALATRRHDRCNRLYWDPSGRYLASCTITDLRNAHTKAHVDDGFNLHTFQGQLICSVKREKLYQFQWRPRPRNLLSAEEKKKIIKNLRKYEKMFEKEDRQRRQELNEEIRAERYRLAEEFLGWLNRNRATNRSLKPRRVELRGGYDSDDERNYKIEVTVDEQVIKTSEQVLHA